MVLVASIIEWLFFNSSFFNTWQNLLEKEVELRGLELSGYIVGIQ